MCERKTREPLHSERSLVPHTHAHTLFNTGSCQGLCAAGTFSPAGYGLIGPSCIPCPAGVFGTGSTIRTNATCDGPCAPGAYCPMGSVSSATLCPVGTFGAGGSSSAACTGQITAGYYGAYTGKTTPQGDGLCQGGTYGAAGATSYSCSGLCAAGRYGLPTTVRVLER